MKRYWRACFHFLCFMGCFALVFFELKREDVEAQQSGSRLSLQENAEIELDVRGMRLKKFPCSQCHGLIEKKEARKGKAHPEIVIRHGETHQECLNCHDASNMDRLRTMDMIQSLPFEESYKVCGQCHGDILEDWELGIHGLQTGFWKGKKLRRTCSECHDPHDPKFKPLKPLPAPVWPDGKGPAH